MNCPWSGPVVEAEWDYVDPRQGALDRLLQKLSDKELVGRQHAERYLRDQYRRNCRPNTMRSSCAGIELFLAFIGGAGKTVLEQITRDDLYGFVEHEQDRGLKPLTVNTRLRSVKAFLRFLIDAEIIDHRVLSRKITIKIPEALPRAMDPDDIRRLLSVIKHIRNRAMVLVLLRTGMRIGELLNTRVHDINFKERKIEIYEAQKNRVGRIVYLSDDAQAVLRAWFDKRDPRKELVFYGQGRNAMTYQGARAMFRKYLKQAGLAQKGYSLHCLRHTFASELLNAGMRLECLQQLLGHSSVEMTRRYARLTDKTREEEYFRAMSIIERGEIDGHYRLDSELQAILKKEELLSPHGEELPEHP
ncbi:MAG: tyrosine-type recombinase/integrase [Desulfobacterales bacterium]|nr:tyrosine-type recombinase/integrase [Desulfobacterales bacterium]